ncbi:MAG: hypothetical protein P4K80_07475 [Acidobacteriaceae bacterium]|nr:hypothetical protein [Acidobacteriaceae bacterium]
MALISEQEKQRRHAIIVNILGASEMQGLTPDADSAEIMRRFEEGELDLEELGAAMSRHANELLPAQDEATDAAESNASVSSVTEEE